MTCFRQAGGCSPSTQLRLTREYRWGSDILAAECSDKCPDRLYTDKHGMDSLCDTDAVQCVSAGPSLVSVRPLFPL